jgi:excisionase family DNA binding protein
VTGSTRRSVAASLLSIGSRVVGALLIGLGRLIRQDRVVDAGKRRFYGEAFERRWISDAEERERHAAIVAERLGIEASAGGVVSVAEAARRLGVSVSTVRRRAQRGELAGAYRDGRLTGIVFDQQ